LNIFVSQGNILKINKNQPEEWPDDEYEEKSKISTPPPPPPLPPPPTLPPPLIKTIQGDKMFHFWT